MLRSRPSEHESAFWRLADWAIRHHYCTARQVAVIARLEPSRKTGYWLRHLRDLKSFLSWRDEQGHYCTERGQRGERGERGTEHNEVTRGQ